MEWFIYALAILFWALCAMAVVCLILLTMQRTRMFLGNPTMLLPQELTKMAMLPQQELTNLEFRFCFLSLIY